MIFFTILLINGRFWCYCNGFDMLHCSKIQSFHGIKAWTKTPAVGAWGGGSQVWLSGAACREALRFGVCKKKLLSPRQTDVWLVSTLWVDESWMWMNNATTECNHVFSGNSLPRQSLQGMTPNHIQSLHHRFLSSLILQYLRSATMFDIFSLYICNLYAWMSKEMDGSQMLILRC